jgi:hypothetical protein
MHRQRQAKPTFKERIQQFVLVVPLTFADIVPPNVAEYLMPTLFRFLFILAVIAGAIYGSTVALVLLVEPRERDVTVRVPSERLNSTQEPKQQP